MPDQPEPTPKPPAISHELARKAIDRYVGGGSAQVALFEYVAQQEAAERERQPRPLQKKVRQAARDRNPLDGTDAQMLEHAITITERERDEARATLQTLTEACAPFLRAWDTSKYGHGVSLRDWQTLGKALHSTKPVGSLWTTPAAVGVAPEPGLALATEQTIDELRGKLREAEQALAMLSSLAGSIGLADDCNPVSIVSVLAMKAKRTQEAEKRAEAAERENERMRTLCPGCGMSKTSCGEAPSPAIKCCPDCSHVDLVEQARHEGYERGKAEALRHVAHCLRNMSACSFGDEVKAFDAAVGIVESLAREPRAAGVEAKCPACRGEGGDGGQADNGTWEWPCPSCGGTGTQPTTFPVPIVPTNAEDERIVDELMAKRNAERGERRMHELDITEERRQHAATKAELAVATYVVNFARHVTCKCGIHPGLADKIAEYDAARGKSLAPPPPTR